LTALAHSPELATPGGAPVAAGSAPSDAAATLYNLHRQRIYAYCVGQLRDRQEADDAVQSTFLYALALLQRGETPRAELPWLYTIAHNVCRTRRRALKRRSRLESAVDLETLHDSVGRNDPAREDLAGLESSLAALPTAQRNALLLREWQGLSYAEIALRLGLTESAVEAVLFRARRNLAQTLRRAGDRAASLTSIFMLIPGLRRLAPFTSTVKTAAAAVAVSAAVAAAVQPLVSPSPTADLKRAGTPPPAAADARPRARRTSPPPPQHTRVHVGTRTGGAGETASAATPSAEPTPTEPPTGSSNATVASQPPVQRSSAIDSSAPAAEPPTTTPTVQTVVSDAGNALPPPVDVVGSLPPALQTAVSTVTAPVEQTIESVVSTAPVEAVVTTVTSLPTLLPGRP
jgi:RNA polymerase sigma factor (sigma-70 family)